MENINHKRTSTALLAGLYGGANNLGLAAIASALSGADSRVNVDRAAKTGSTDGKVIRLPHPDVMEVVAPGYGLDPARGMLDHELSHNRWTDFSVRPQGGTRHTILNVLEDERIERLAVKAMPGSAKNLDALNKWAEAFAPQAQESCTRNGAIITAVMVVAGRTRLLTDRPTEDLKISLRTLEPHAKRIRAKIADPASTTADMQAMANEIVEIFSKAASLDELNEQPKPPQDAPTNNGNQGGAAQDDSRDGQDGQDGNQDGQDSKDGKDGKGSKDGKESKGSKGSEGSDGSTESKQGGSGSGSESKKGSPSGIIEIEVDSDNHTAQRSAADLLKDKIRDENAKKQEERFAELRRESLAEGLTPEKLENRASLLKKTRKVAAEQEAFCKSRRNGSVELELERKSKDFGKTGAHVAVTRSEYGDELLRDAIKAMRPSVARLRAGLANALRRRGIKDPIHAQRSGDLDPVTLAAAGAGLTDRCFSIDNSAPGQADLRIVLAMDVSGSMRAKLVASAKALAALGEALSGLPNVDLGVVRFTGHADVCKAFGTRWPVLPNRTDAVFRGLTAAVAALGGTDVAAGITTSIALLRTKRARGGREAIFVITDGCADNSERAITAVDLARKEGIEVFGLGLESLECMRWLEAESCAFATESDMHQALLDMVGKLILKSDV